MGELFLSRNYRWDEEAGEIRDVRTDTRTKDSVYDVKVSVFEDRFLTWFLDVAESLCGREYLDGDYVAVMVAVAYIDAAERYRRGKRPPNTKSGEWFKNSARGACQRL